MTVPVQPIYIGGAPVYCKFFALARNPGDPSRIEGTFTIIGGEGVLTLDALVGPRGIPGEPSPIIRPQFGSPITDPADLPNPAVMDDSDNGRAWYIGGQWHIWFEGEYVVVQGSIEGPPGITPDISVTAEMVELPEGVPAYGPITVDESGTTTYPNFNIKIPGIPGPEGPAASIRLAADFDNSGFEIGKFIAAIDDTPTERYGLVSPSIIYPKLWTIPESNWIEHTGSEGRFLIATLNVPAQDYDWYPDVVGHVQIQQGLFSTVQAEIEVRVGNTGSSTGESEGLCALGPYDPSVWLLDGISICHILPHFSDASDPLRSISPDTLAGRNLQGQAYTFYVFVHKIGGAGTYQFTKPDAQLRVMAFPVAPGA
jgi:hypothetical protein